MKKATLIIFGLVWIMVLIILIISLTNLYPNNIFREYRLIIGIALLTITGLLKPIYNSVINKVN
ncbi:hypothetical protein FF125_06825 [Aureibaculum algae]|uniref:Uncharacterized protein n=1 Tax=Aureibaculum algae TaxID=2584122 RepID=A0A5B7TNH4_9FLAO|nr:hypothetical protein [Aureibaculum algae]QCX38155.1 hypothetical protein FF125_06825 [Aureibaculum algae]